MGLNVERLNVERPNLEWYRTSKDWISKRTCNSIIVVLRSFEVRSFSRFSHLRFGHSRFGLSTFSLSRFSLSRFGHSRFGHGFAVLTAVPLTARPQCAIIAAQGCKTAYCFIFIAQSGKNTVLKNLPPGCKDLVFTSGTFSRASVFAIIEFFLHYLAQGNRHTRLCLIVWQRIKRT